MTARKREGDTLPERLRTALIQAAVLIIIGTFCAFLFNALRSDTLPWARGRQAEAPVKAGRIPAMDLEDAWRGYEQGSLQFIDAREPSDFQAGHLPGALNVPSGGEAGHLEQIRGIALSGRDLVLYCSDPECPISRASAERLIKWGVTRVRILPGGWTGWVKAGFPVEGGAEK